jgi:2-amino-4-hydroxy-6-hydroxymethyldihydropteridine diphosphokinase
MQNIFLGLGSNLGKRAENLKEAISRIEERTGSPVFASGIYETEPWGFSSEDKFLNMVLRISTDIPPSKLLNEVLSIESQMGRVRSSVQYSSRIIDVDILLYGCRVIVQKNLVVPHPRLHERRFVLVPMCEIAPEIYHPVLRRPMTYLLEKCEDNSKVDLFVSPILP